MNKQTKAHGFTGVDHLNYRSGGLLCKRRRERIVELELANALEKQAINRLPQNEMNVRGRGTIVTSPGQEDRSVN